MALYIKSVANYGSFTAKRELIANQAAFSFIDYLAGETDGLGKNRGLRRYRLSPLVK